METVEEQVLPFVAMKDGASVDNGNNSFVEAEGDLSHSKPDLSLSSRNNHFPHQSSVMSNGRAVAHHDRLGNFHRKMNKIILDNLAISKEKDRLILENSQLEDLISQYISGLKITETSIVGDNPLLVINGR